MDIFSIELIEKEIFMIPIKRLCSKIILPLLLGPETEQSNCFPVSALVHKIRLTQKQPDFIKLSFCHFLLVTNLFSPISH